MMKMLSKDLMTVSLLTYEQVIFFQKSVWLLLDCGLVILQNWIFRQHIFYTTLFVNLINRNYNAHGF